MFKKYNDYINITKEQGLIYGAFEVYGIESFDLQYLSSNNQTEENLRKFKKGS